MITAFLTAIYLVFSYVFFLFYLHVFGVMDGAIGFTVTVYLYRISTLSGMKVVSPY